MARILLFGASNVRRSLPAIVRLAQREFGAGLEIFGAFGHGRSYGKRSCIPFRCLPGILESGLWGALADAGGKADLAVAADAGNDILYGEDTPTILRWVAECLRRADAERRAIVGLPVHAIRRLAEPAFLLFRTLFFPASRLSHEAAVRRTEDLNAGLRELARAVGARFVEPEARWYHVDPIHIRPRRKIEAWGEILDVHASPHRGRRLDAGRLLMAAPERRTLFGIERRREQPALTLREGTRLFLY